MGKKLAIIMIIVLLIGVFLVLNVKIEKSEDVVPESILENSDQPKIIISDLAKQVHDLVNVEREKQGLETLAWDDALAEIAEKHSKDMVEKDYFSHNSLSGCDVNCRYAADDYECMVPTTNGWFLTGAENICQDSKYHSYQYSGDEIISYDWKTSEEIAESIVSSWMNSEGHRKNILTKYWKNEGIGIYVSKDYEVFVTQNFC